MIGVTKVESWKYLFTHGWQVWAHETVLYTGDFVDHFASDITRVHG